MSITKLIFPMLWLSLATGCGATPPQLAATIDETGLHVATDPPSALASLELTQGELPIQVWSALPARRTIDLSVPVTPGATYTLHAVWRKQALPNLIIAAPAAADVPLRITLHPIGTNEKLTLLPSEDDHFTLPLPAGDNKLVLNVDHLLDSAGVATLIYPAALLPEPQGDRSQVRRIPFEFMAQRYTETFQVRLKSQPQALRLVLQYASNDTPGLREWERIITLLPLDEAALASQIAINSTTLPAPRSGAPPSPVRESTIRLPDRTWETIGGWFGIPPAIVHPDTPYSSIQLQLTNRGSTALPVLCALSVRESGSANISPMFQPSTWLATGGPSAAQVVRHVVLAPGDTAVTLPIYVRPKVQPGRYVVRVSGTLLGSDAKLFETDVPLQVIRPGSLVTLTLLVTVLIALVTLAMLIGNWHRLLSSMPAGELISLALIAAMLAGGTLISGALNLMLAALLGPFNVFVGELATELWTAGCLTLALCFRPRVGTFALLYLTHALLRAVLAGQMQVLDLLIAGSAIGITESLLWLLGVTSLPRSAHAGWLFGLRLILALSLADLLGTWIQLALGMGLYRLQYAEWYLLATVVITGFGFTALGVAWTLPLGTRLRRLHG